MKVTDAIVHILYEQGVRTVFGYQGSSIAHLIDSIDRHPDIEFIETRNEQGASFAACGYAIATGNLGVAVSCSGPGALNMVSGIADAYYDSLPCLFLTGQVSQREMKGSLPVRQLGFQETDFDDVVKPISKSAITVKRPQDIPAVIEDAIAVALRKRKGPTVVTLPHNIQNAAIEEPPICLPKNTEEGGEAPDSVGHLAPLLASSRRPTIIIGGGCEHISRKTISAINELCIPVVTSYRGKGLYDNTLDSYCGTIGVYGSRAANLAVKLSDLLICIGTRLDGRQTGYEPLQVGEKQNVIVFDIDDNELAKYPDEYIAIRDEAQNALDSLISAAKGLKKSEHWLAAIRGWEMRYPSSLCHAQDSPNPLTILGLLSDAAPKNANFVLDVGQNQLWANNALSIDGKRCLVQSSGLGAMGFSVPAGIGAYAGNKKQTICITGDGGMQMNIQELQTATYHQIPLKVVILNNGCLGLIRDYQAKALESRFAGSVQGFGSPDYALIAQAYGFRYERIDSCAADDLTAALHDESGWIIEVTLNDATPSYPEPVYGSSIVNQAPALSDEEMRRIMDEASAV